MIENPLREDILHYLVAVAADIAIDPGSGRGGYQARVVQLEGLQQPVVFAQHVLLVVTEIFYLS